MSLRVPVGLRGTGRDAFASERSAALPFLPTLFTALCIGVLSLLCRPSLESTGPREPVVAAASLQPGADGFHAAPNSSAATHAMPATVAFGVLYPLNPDGTQLAGAPPRSPSALRVASTGKRGCGSARCAEAKRSDPVRAAANSARPQPDPVATSSIPAGLRYARTDEPSDDSLPPDALPFLPAAASAADAVRTLSGGAVSLGGSVLGALALPR